MCELFGLSCAQKDRATKSLPEFAQLSEYNPDGWGIAWYENNEVKIKKRARKAKESKLFFEIVNKAKSNIIVAHIRKKTKGEACKKNCHPFVQKFRGRNWIFAHNGTIVPTPEIHPRSQGTTDSEQIFNYLLDEVQNYLSTYNIHHPIRGIYPAIKFALREIFKTYRPENTTLNFLLSDGSVLYAFGHYYDKPLYFLRREKDYGGAILVSTVQLTDEDWQMLPFNRLLVINNGDILVLSDLII